MRQKCPVCKKYLLVEPHGPEKAPLLTIGDEPGGTETMTGLPWSGDGGKVFKAELMRTGMKFLAMRHTNVYQHASKGMSDADVKWHQSQVMKEMTGRRGILIMGASASELLLGDKISEYSCVDVTDLLKTRHPYDRDWETC